MKVRRFDRDGNEVERFDWLDDGFVDEIVDGLEQDEDGG